MTPRSVILCCGLLAGCQAAQVSEVPNSSTTELCRDFRVEDLPDSIRSREDLHRAVIALTAAHELCVMTEELRERIAYPPEPWEDMDLSFGEHCLGPLEVLPSSIDVGTVGYRGVTKDGRIIPLVGIELQVCGSQNVPFGERLYVIATLAADSWKLTWPEKLEITPLP